MPTPIFACGMECGVRGAVGQHWSLANEWSISTTTVRNGLRSLRSNVFDTNNATSGPDVGTTVPTRVWRDVLRFAALPTGNCILSWHDYGTSAAGIGFKVSDGTLRAAVEIAGVIAFGSTGTVISLNTWYVCDVKTVGNVVTGTCDMQVDSVALGQAVGAFAQANVSSLAPKRGSNNITINVDMFFEDYLLSETAADYPLGDGYVLSNIPNADGTHNVAGANDFERSATGTDITNATTTAYQLVDDRPLKSGAPDTEFINMIAPPNATDYVELAFEDSTESVAPRSIEVIAKVAQAATTTGNMELRLNDNGSMGVIYTATAVAGVVNGTYVRAHFADPPSAASAWGLGGAGNGDFNNVKVRFGSPAALDVVPDQYLVSIMIEAEYAPLSVGQPIWKRYGGIKNTALRGGGRSKIGVW